MFSRSCQYALQAVLYICLHGGRDKAIKVQDISDSQHIPVHFLGKILQILVRHNILDSTKGPNGGFIMNENQDELTMLEIVRIIDGLDIFDQCGIGLKECSDESPCPIHHDYKAVKQKIRTLLNRKTIADLCIDVENGKSIVSFIPVS
jgi:Rrf2 family protein